MSEWIPADTPPDSHRAVLAWTGGRRRRIVRYVGTDWLHEMEPNAVVDVKAWRELPDPPKPPAPKCEGCRFCIDESPNENALCAQPDILRQRQKEKYSHPLSGAIFERMENELCGPEGKLFEAAK